MTLKQVGQSPMLPNEIMFLLCARKSISYKRLYQFDQLNDIFVNTDLSISVNTGVSFYRYFLYL